MRRYSKPRRPVFRGGHPLARGVVFALAPWLGGARHSDGRCDVDYRAMAPGFIQGSIAGAYVTADYGLSLSTGGSVDPIWYTDNSVRGLCSPSGRAMTISVLWRVRNTTDAGAILCKGNRPSGTVNGWSIERDSTARQPRWQTYDAGTDDVDDTNAIAMRQTIHTIARCAGLSRNNELYLYRNGTRVAYVFPGVPNPPAPNTLPVALFGNAAAKSYIYPCEVGQVVIWDRYLPDSAANMLTTDPFCIWS